MGIAFGRYDYWLNFISISRLLNTPRVSKEAVKSVIFHELLHQEMDEHTMYFKNKLKTFPRYDKCQEELNSYFKNPDPATMAPVTVNLEINLDQVLFCVVHPRENENFLDSFHFCNHYFYVDIGKKNAVSEEFAATKNPHIVWVVKGKDRFCDRMESS